MDTDLERPKGGHLLPQKHILLVEDEDHFRKMVALMLKRLGYLVQEASSGEEALRLAQVNPEKIDLLMTDVLMPGMSGRELAELLQSRDAAMKVLFLSGHPIHLQAAFLQKPFTVDAVSKKLREVLDLR